MTHLEQHPRIEIIGPQTRISKPEQKFCGWPTLTRRRNGDLLVACSGGRDYHVCPYGRVHLLVSRDDGHTWDGPSILSSGPIDDRDSGVLETAQGTLVVTWFTSLTYERNLDENLSDAARLAPEERLQWEALRSAMSDQTRIDSLGCWSVRSTDNGVTWSTKTDTLVGSPHGPIGLSNGDLLYVGKFRVNDAIGFKRSPFRGRVGAALSRDDGIHWEELSEITPMPGHDALEYHELHGVEAADGRIVVHIRNHCSPHVLELLQTESFDGGRTWRPVHPTGLWGYPGHLLRLADGTLLATYGHRRDPLGNRVAVSRDHGETWSEPMQLTTMGGADFGYPSTAELPGGELLTLWYDRPAHQRVANLHLTRWRLVG